MLRFIFIIAVSLFVLNACSSSSEIQNRPRPDQPSLARMSSDEILIQENLAAAQQASSPEKEQLLLSASTLLLNLDRIEEARSVLQDIALTDLGLDLTSEILLQSARVEVADEKYPQALTFLNHERLELLPRLTETRQVSIRLLRALIYEHLDMHQESARERIQADKFLPEGITRQNHELIWNSLVAMPLAELENAANSELNYELQGWYELGYIGKAYQFNLDRQLIELERWLRVWRRHPAYSVLPESLQLIDTMASERPEVIALLLPFQTTAGSVIRDGFLSAYYDMQELGGKVPTVRLYDTSNATDIIGIYQKAVADGAMMVIGPLLKENVFELHNSPNLPVPTLALNNIEGSSPLSDQLFQFSLSPENEARQIALKAFSDGHRVAAILGPLDAPGNDFFKRKRNSFISEWQKLGGRIVAQQVYQNEYTEPLKNLLAIEESEARREKLGNIINEDLVYTQRRRQDIDFIFLIAEPGPGRQINPTLAYLFAGDIPVYATQDIYSGQPSPLEDSDLNGVRFGISPWILSGDDELKTRTQQHFPHSSALNLRLQAFGIDAFRLYPRLKQLSSVQNSQIYGATGMLKLGDGQHIYRELSWARINDGLIAPISD